MKKLENGITTKEQKNENYTDILPAITYGLTMERKEKKETERKNLVPTIILSNTFNNLIEFYMRIF